MKKQRKWKEKRCCSRIGIVKISYLKPAWGFLFKPDYRQLNSLGRPPKARGLELVQSVHSCFWEEFFWEDLAGSTGQHCLYILAFLARETTFRDHFICDPQRRMNREQSFGNIFFTLTHHSVTFNSLIFLLPISLLIIPWQTFVWTLYQGDDQKALSGHQVYS